MGNIKHLTHTRMLQDAVVKNKSTLGSNSILRTKKLTGFIPTYLKTMCSLIVLFNSEKKA